MKLPSAELLGLAYGFSEGVLSVYRRSGTQAAATDGRSLRVLWAVILCSVVAGIAALSLLPQARSDLLARLYGVGVAIFVVGLVLRWYAIAEDHRVVESGPYRFLRHPAYAGALLAFVGFGICLGNWLALLAVTVPIAWAFLRRIEVEESALGSALGESYVAYARRTRRLVPFLY